MPSVQQGSVVKGRGKSGTYLYRYYDQDGQRRQKSGFRTRSEARQALRQVLDEMRNGPRSRQGVIVQEFVDEYLEQHIAEENTIATLTFRLKHVTSAFGDRRLAGCRFPRLRVGERRGEGQQSGAEA